MPDHKSAPSAETMISVDHLSKVFQPGDIQAVSDISFSLKTGEVGCIIGTSGCGKTTTLKMINRLEEPTSGEVVVGGKSHLSSDPITWRRGIGYVIQKAGLLPHMTVFENISLLSRLLKRSNSKIEERVKELLEIVNLPFGDYAHRYPKELSGGQQQRVGIARALMEDPPVMLMDEPFGALDPITRNSLHDEFMELNERLKKTILIVTHDIDEAFKLGNKIILMDEGKIVQMGSRAEFLSKPANPFVESFIKGQEHV